MKEYMAEFEGMLNRHAEQNANRIKTLPGRVAKFGRGSELSPTGPEYYDYRAIPP